MDNKLLEGLTPEQVAYVNKLEKANQDMSTNLSGLRQNLDAVKQEKDTVFNELQSLKSQPAQQQVQQTVPQVQTIPIVPQGFQEAMEFYNKNKGFIEDIRNQQAQVEEYNKQIARNQMTDIFYGYGIKDDEIMPLLTEIEQMKGHDLYHNPDPELLSFYLPQFVRTENNTQFHTPGAQQVDNTYKADVNTRKNIDAIKAEGIERMKAEFKIKE